MHLYHNHNSTQWLEFMNVVKSTVFEYQLEINDDNCLEATK